MQYVSITPDQGLVFPSVRYMRSLISKAAAKQVIIAASFVIILCGTFRFLHQW